MSHISNVELKAAPDFTQETDFIAVGMFKDSALPGSLAALDAAMDGLISAVRERKNFTGKKDESLVLHGQGQVARVALIGLGKPEKFTLDLARQAAGNAVKAAKGQKAVRCELLQPDCDLDSADLAQALTEGMILSSYKFDAHKKKEEDAVDLTGLALLGDVDTAGAGRGTIIANAACLTREMQNEPANIMTPTRLAAEAERIGQAANMKTMIWDREGIEKLGMGALRGVALGSNEPPRFMTIEYSGGAKGDAPFAIVGKGLTFDSGGISIKASANMDEMKFDMSGGAVVLGVMEAIAHLQPKINIIAAVPSTENLLGGSAQRPGDIVKAYNGKTIEILNTDAEGRLILADALSYVVDVHKPAAIVDLATLTGAVLIALGHRASGMLGNDDDLLAEVQAAADHTGERVWQLPMWEEYSEDIKSKVADVKNMGSGRLSGTVAGAVFLKEFVGDMPWVHLDIAGTAWQDKDQPYVPGGGSGVGVRLLTSLLLKRAG